MSTVTVEETHPLQVTVTAGTANEVTVTADTANEVTITTGIPISAILANPGFIEAVQDAAFGAIADSSTIDATYNDAGDLETLDVIPSGIDVAALASSFAAGAVPFSDGTNLVVDATNIYWDNLNKKLIVGDINAEAIAGFNLLGTIVQPRVNVNDIALGNVPQHLIHKHSTVFPPILVGSRANSDTSAHADVANGMPVFNIQGYGWAGLSYKTFGQIAFEVDADGTVNDTSAPGRITFWTTPTGSTLLMLAAYVDRQQKFHAVKEILSDGLSLSKMALINL